MFDEKSGAWKASWENTTDMFRKELSFPIIEVSP